MSNKKTLNMRNVRLSLFDNSIDAELTVEVKTYLTNEKLKDKIYWITNEDKKYQDEDGLPIWCYGDIFERLEELNYIEYPDESYEELDVRL